MPTRSIVIPACVAAAVVAVVAWAARSPVESHPMNYAGGNAADVVAEVDRYLQQRWNEADLTPAEPADELTVLRRLSLALHGTIPSLEEIREFEADTEPHRLDRWTQRMLEDPRFGDYFAERLARSYVGTEGGAFVLYRRDRFTQWLAEQLQENAPYDEIVRQIIGSDGLWTGVPQTNFITAAIDADNLDENKLAGRCVRAFLGQRMDCAQCHDHPYADWKQDQFEGLAAQFGQTRITMLGVEDRTKKDGNPIEYTVEDRETLEERTVEPAVPFGEEWLPEEGNRRERLAAWITHPENRRFERAIANRVWGLMFGRPYVHPVDDLPDPPDEPDLLDILGRDFRAHECDLRRLIQVIAASQSFRLSSEHPTQDDGEFDRLKDNWAVFPLVRLRPEQVIGSMIQAASIKTVDQNSHLLTRTVRLLREGGFVKDYGDLGEDELDNRAGTIPQALLRMNGNLTREMSEPSPLTSSGRMSLLARDPKTCLETCYLVCLTRRPTEEEREHLLPQLKTAGKNQRGEILQDWFWTLFNAPEFSWNH